jgi:RNA 2',3'-cyclic 3'-phosphodiesterase
VGTADERTARLFVAVPLPESVLPFVVRAQGLLPHTGGLRLVERAQLHCTLAFIGRVDSRMLEAARQVVSGVAGSSGGEAVLEGFLFLPSPRRARVVALGIDDDQGVFGRLFETVMSGLETSGVMQREKRPFRPHVTVARLRVPGLVQPTSDCGRAGFGVESLCLYESELRRQGAVHTLLVRSDLQRAHGQ